MNVQGFLAIPVAPDNLDEPTEWYPNGVPRFTKRYPTTTSGPIIVVELDIAIPDTAIQPPLARLNVPEGTVRLPVEITGEDAEEPEG